MFRIMYRSGTVKTALSKTVKNTDKRNCVSFSFECDLGTKQRFLIINVMDSVPNCSELRTTGKLVDLDWQFGVTAASSERNLVGETFVHVKMILATRAKEREVLNIQLTAAQFYNLLHDLEKARISLE